MSRSVLCQRSRAAAFSDRGLPRQRPTRKGRELLSDEAVFKACIRSGSQQRCSLHDGADLFDPERASARIVVKY